MSKVLAKVNAQEITEKDLNEMTNAYMQQSQKQEISDEERDALLQNLVQNALLREAADERKIEVTDEILDAQLQAMFQQYGGEESFMSIVAQQGINFDEIKDGIAADLKGQLAAKDEIDKKLDLSDEELQAFYAENSEEIKTEESFRASHILFSNEAEDAKESAEKVLAELKAEGDFAEMAEKHSTCPSKAKGGDLGFFGKGQMVPEFEAAVIQLDTNEISELIETQFGFHIIQKSDHKEGKHLSFEEAKEQIKEVVTRGKSEVIVRELIEELTEKCEITYM